MARYQPYPEYKDSGVDWLDKMPKHWHIKRLKFAVYLINDKIDAQASDLDYMGLEHIESWSGRRIDDELAASDGIATRFLPKDVLFGKLRPYLAKVYLANHEGLVSTEALVLRPTSHAHEGFLRYYMVSRDFIRTVDSSTYGSKMPRASWEFIGNLPVLLPDHDEQKSIARFLDRKTAQIDALISKKELLLEKLAEKRVALISHAVTKGLNPNVKMKDSGVEWLGEVPEHWKVAGLTKYLNSVVDYRGKTPEKTKDGIFLVTAKNIKDGQINYELSQEYVAEEEYQEIMSRGVPRIGDVVFTTEAPLGEVANVDNPNIALAQRVIKFRGRENILDNYFLKYWIMSSLFQQNLTSLCTGSTALGIKSSKLCLLRLALPPLKEQLMIVDFLNRVIHKSKIHMDSIRVAIEKLKEYRSALITQAVTGKIDVRNFEIPEVVTKEEAA